YGRGDVLFGMDVAIKVEARLCSSRTLLLVGHFEQPDVAALVGPADRAQRRQLWVRLCQGDQCLREAGVVVIAVVSYGISSHVPLRLRTAIAGGTGGSGDARSLSSGCDASLRTDDPQRRRSRPRQPLTPC